MNMQLCLQALLSFIFTMMSTDALRHTTMIQTTMKANILKSKECTNFRFPNLNIFSQMSHCWLTTSRSISFPQHHHHRRDNDGVNRNQKFGNNNILQNVWKQSELYRKTCFTSLSIFFLLRLRPAIASISIASSKSPKTVYFTPAQGAVLWLFLFTVSAVTCLPSRTCHNLSRTSSRTCHNLTRTLPRTNPRLCTVPSQPSRRFLPGRFIFIFIEICFFSLPIISLLSSYEISGERVRGRGR